MENFFANQFSWSYLLLISTILIIVYIVLQSSLRFFKRVNIFGNLQQPLKNITHFLLLTFEPLALLIWLTTFVLINYTFHGLLALLFLILGFSFIRDYINGQIVKFDPLFIKGKQLRASKVEGIIFSLGKLGIKVKTNRGIQFLNYSELTKQGYLLLSGEEISGFNKLEIGIPEKSDSKKTQDNFQYQLTDLLAFSPYLDWNHKPEIMPSNNPNLLNAKVLVREEQHLHELISSIKEWGYTCKINTK